jgi:hypothetical protein
MLSPQREKTALLLTVSPGASGTAQRLSLKVKTVLLPIIRSASTAATGMPKSTSGKTRQSYWPPTMPQMASTTLSSPCALTSGQKHLLIR